MTAPVGTRRSTIGEARSARTHRPRAFARASVGAAIAIVAATALCGCAARAERRSPGGPATGATVSTVRTFASADAAWDAFVGAVRSGSTDDILAVLGDDARPFVVSADGLDDAAARRRFLERVDQRTVLRGAEDGTVTAHVGEDFLPFPIPLVHGSAGWYFDTLAGRDAVVRRRIEYDEKRAAAMCRTYAYAQHEYASRQLRTSARMQYARRLISTPGTRDGLYWPAASRADESPMAVLVTAAEAEGYPRGTPGEHVLYYGYVYRMLTAQGPHAPGGAHSYLEGDALTRGFALVGRPAEYGVTGVHTFLVNQDGVVRQRDLGPDTAAIVDAMTAYDPDPSWSPAP